MHGFIRLLGSVAYVEKVGFTNHEIVERLDCVEHIFDEAESPSPDWDKAASMLEGSQRSKELLESLKQDSVMLKKAPELWVTERRESKALMAFIRELCKTEFFNIVGSRRKTTEFEQIPVPNESLRTLVEAGHYSPTGRGLLSREFLLVTDKSTLIRLGETHPHGKWVANAPATIVIIGNPKKSRYWVEDCSIAAEHIWLAATAMGLGASWCAVYQSDDSEESMRREDHVRDALMIPGELRPLAIIAIGIPSDTQPSRSATTKSGTPLNEVLHLERYG